MSKQKITIEVDLPERFEIIGECDTQPFQTVLHCIDGRVSLELSRTYLLRKIPPKPTFPSWFPSGWWIARDENGAWCGFECKPMVSQGYWFVIGNGPFGRTPSFLHIRDMSTFANLPDASVPWTECCYQCVRSEE